MVECPKCCAENPEAPSLTKTLETPLRVLRPGAVVADKYRIIDEVSHGGTGVVYKAEDIKLKSLVPAGKK